MIKVNLQSFFIIIIIIITIAVVVNVITIILNKIIKHNLAT